VLDGGRVVSRRLDALAPALTQQLFAHQLEPALLARHLRGQPARQLFRR
jgi:hypothetical protein